MPGTTKLKPAGLLVKWLIIPILVAAFGYYVIGPRFGMTKPAPEPQQAPAPKS